MKLTFTQDATGEDASGSRQRRNGQSLCQKIRSGIGLWVVLIGFAAFYGSALEAQQSRQQTSRGIEAMVAAVHPLASQAGLDAINAGGNAVDAAVAASLTLGVVDGFNSGIGGGCFIIIRTPDGEVICIDGREMAPAAATRDMFMIEGKPDTMLSQVGPLASGVPGALAGYAEAVGRFGRRSLRDLILPAAEIAEQGFEVSPSYARAVAGNFRYFQQYAGSLAVFQRGEGQALQAGDRFQQPDLAATYRAIGSEGTDWFYRGPFAEQTAQWMEENGGIMTAADFANYHTVSRAPLETTYRGYTIYGFPPPSSGGVHVGQILNILEGFDLAELHRTQPAVFTHLVAEAMKLAFADRAYWLGDPDYVNVPKGLIDKGYAATLAQRIDLTQAIRVESHGVPPLADVEFFEKHTTHIAAADAEGYWVGITTTVNTTFGSKVIVPGLGVIMNNQMDDFAIAPGVPNAFGLVGAEANCVAGGKRPLSSMSPTIVVREGQPVMTVGAAGGPRIITQSLLATVRVLDLGMPVDQALAAPRFHQQWSPDKLYLERGFDAPAQQALEQLGHPVELTGVAGVSQAIWYDAEKGELVGAADPRAGGAAIGK